MVHSWQNKYFYFHYLWKSYIRSLSVLVLDVVLGQSSEAPVCVLLAPEMSPSVFTFVLPSQAGKDIRGHAGPPVCSLPWNWHGTLAYKWPCGKRSVGIGVGTSFWYKWQICEHVDLQTWSLKAADRCGCVLLTVTSDACGPQWGTHTGPMKLQLMKSICLFLVGFERCVEGLYYSDWIYE